MTPTTRTLSARRTDGRLKRGEASRYYRYLIPGLLGLIIVVIVPALANLGLSFTQWSGVGTPEFVGLDNYSALMGDATFWRAFGNSAATIVAMAIIPTFAGLFLAALLFDFLAPRFGGATSSLFRTVIYLPQIIPIAVAGVLWDFLLQPQTGAVNAALRAVGLDQAASNWLGDPSLALPTVMVILVWLQLGYTVVIFVAGMSRIDPALHEAASLDGASWLQRFRVITVSSLAPEIIVILLTTTVAALKVFAPIYVLTAGGPANATMVPSYFAFYNFFSTLKVGYGAAISTVLAVLLTVLAVVLLAIQHRHQEGSR
ncbi:carbohydrate ABC transporter permease [Demequina lignilytica]|uniref:Sugar ABC transporter permease n=1 Tax=Demequina lignilytica TaxID=3051663 RepID=A0AAW7M501_9MICO|nr:MULTISPECIES: sugar ABC transporter permease [unclassified Demequina]MDN4479213.1 sugar ABC transporter permease [Demequina sp. SYSU T00039-1]MDN4484439.1 sugar ABC transporter permease [Demequina sp. SYSU T0a273]MDN4487928.1 sugar ABC transporter permease [Demequina sp. SYSU T00039]MDN4491734.1 sugar ABC transporter permease [Demequina sp. SYSU T00068]